MPRPRSRARLAAAVCVVLAAAACGKKGPPLQPFSDLPREVRGLDATRVGRQMVIELTVPNANVDNREPANLAEIELYMSPTRLLRSADYLARERLVESILVREPPPEDPEDPESPEAGADAGSGEAPQVAEPVEPPPGVPQGVDTTVVLDLDEAAFDGVPFEESLDADDEEEDAAGEAGPDSPPAIELLPGGGGPLMMPPPVRSLYYVAVGVNRRGRRGPASPVVEVPLYDVPPTPGAPVITYTETTMTMAWPPPARPRRPIQSEVLRYTVLESRALPAPVRPPIQVPLPEGTNLRGRPLPRLPIRPILSTTFEHEALESTAWASAVSATGYNVYEVEGPVVPPLVTGAPAREPLNRTPLDEETYQLTSPVFGEERCFLVRVEERRGAVRLESEASSVGCVLPVDTFPPAAPSNLFSVGSAGAISLIWDPNDEADLSGYLVLRGDAAGETLQALTPAPISETTYRDTSVEAGVTYQYAVVAVDTAGNRGEESGRVTERGR